jgi:hypothetical protein
LCYPISIQYPETIKGAAVMPHDLANLALEALKIVNQFLDGFVTLGAAQPLTPTGSQLVDALSQAAVGIAHAMAQLAMNNPIS